MKNIYQMDLFSEKFDLTIRKIGIDDVKRNTDLLEQFKETLLKHEQMYPGINKWLTNKVLPGIKSGKRIAYLGYKNNEPLVSAVAKKGKTSKFCHLHIDKEMRNNNLGEIFFSMMAVNIRNLAKSVYFTLPESVWIDKKEFFKSFGFNEALKSKIQYRSYEEELISTTNFSNLWINIREKLPKIITSLTPSNENIFTGLLMSIKPQYLKKLESGEKIVEIRKKFNKKWHNCRVTLYSSSPDQALFGHAIIEKIFQGSPQDIWERHESEIGCTKREYDEYLSSSDKAYAIYLKDYCSYLNPLYLNHISFLINREVKPPQSYLSVEKNKEWTEAISLAELLHGRFELYASHI